MPLNKQSAVKKRSVIMRGHKTSLSLEDAFWDEIGKLAAKNGITVGEYLYKLFIAKPEGQGLSSAARCAVLREAQRASR